MANESTNLTQANFIPEIWASEIQRFAQSRLVLADRIKRFDSQVKGKGDTVHIPKISEVTAAAKSRGVDVAPDATTEGVVNLAIDQHYYAAKDIEDMAKIQSASDLMEAYTQPLGYSIAKKIDSTIAALQSGLSQSVGAAGSALTDAVLLSGIVLLDEADAPESDRHLVCRPDLKADLLVLTKFVLFQNVGPSPDGSRVQTGKLGEVYGCDVAVSTNIAVTSGTPDTSENLLFHKEAFCAAIQQAPRVQSEYELRGLSNLLVVDAIWGVAEYRDTFGVNIDT